MSLAVQFTTIVEMFHHLFTKFASREQPYLMHKKNGAYVGITYAEAQDMVTRFAFGMMELGIEEHDRVAILSENRPEWVIADVASLALRCVDVPIFPSQTAKQIEFILNDSGARAIIVSNQFQLAKVLKIRENVPSLRHVIVMNEKVDNAPDDVLRFTRVMELGSASVQFDPHLLSKASRVVRPEDLCTIIYTSGTTGNPKGVMLSHSNFVSNITASSQVLPITTDDLLLSFLPLCHVFERMAGYYTAMACGAVTAYAESIETVADNLLEVHPTIVCAVPRLFERIHTRILRKVEKDPASRRKIFAWAIAVGRAYAKARRAGRISAGLGARHALADRLVFSKLKARVGGRIKFFVSGGAALPRELGEFFEAVGVLIIEGYGLTESSPVIAANRPEAYRFGTVGHPIPGVEVRIAEDGEILTRGPHVMMGYYNNPEATAESIDSDGWLHTGDIGTIDSEGFISITDRKKHLFVSSGGKNIAPQPIENLFAGTEFIEQFVLIGDKRMFLSALIVPDYDALADYARAHGIKFGEKSELAQNPEIQRLIEERIQGAQKDLASFERVRRFTLLEEPLTIENGGLTPTLKVKRKDVEARYKDVIETMYKT